MGLLEDAEGPSALGIPPWRRTLGDEPAKALTILSQDSVKHVDERRQPEPAQDAAEWSGKLELGEQHDAPTPVARDWPPIAGDEPPTFGAPFLRHRGEQAPGLLIGERKQGQFFTSIKRGDDPRRPTAEPSAAGIEQNGPLEVRDARYARAHALSTLSRRTIPRPRLHKADELLRHHISYELGRTTVDSAIKDLPLKTSAVSCMGLIGGAGSLGSESSSHQDSCECQRDQGRPHPAWGPAAQFRLRKRPREGECLDHGHRYTVLEFRISRDERREISAPDGCTRVIQQLHRQEPTPIAHGVVNIRISGRLAVDQRDETELQRFDDHRNHNDSDDNGQYTA